MDSEESAVESETTGSTHCSVYNSVHQPSLLLQVTMKREPVSQNGGGDSAQSSRSSSPGTTCLGGGGSSPPPLTFSLPTAANTTINAALYSPSPIEDHMSYISAYSDELEEESPPLSPSDVYNNGSTPPTPSNCHPSSVHHHAQHGGGNGGGSHKGGGDSGGRRACLVCGDTASGFHYGVASCEACKAFFKRTIQGNIEYTCPANNDCEINKRRRKACQACRFQKCLQMGMLKEGVRLDRVRGGRQKYRRNPEGVPYQAVAPPVKRISLNENAMLVSLMACEPEPLSVRRNQTLVVVDESGEPIDSKEGILFHNQSMLQNLCQLTDQQLVATIGWAKQIPGFIELKLDDQMRLLQMAWPEVFSLSLAYRTWQYGHRGLAFATDLLVDERCCIEELRCEEYYNLLLALVRQLEHLRMTREEYVTLKAIALLNACDGTFLLDSECGGDDDECSNHSACGATLRLRNQLLQSLFDIVLAMHPTHAATTLSLRYAQLLLVLPSLKKLDQSLRRFWLDAKRRVTMNKLFSEMLEAPRFSMHLGTHD